MKKALTLTLSFLLLLSLPFNLVQAKESRDILLISRSVGSWLYTDIVITLESDGTRLWFDLRQVPDEIKHDQDKLLAFLQTYGLDKAGLLPDVPAPRPLESATEELAEQIAGLHAQIKETPWEPTFYAFDAGSFILYAAMQADGHARLVPLYESGSYRGISPDAAARQLVDLAMPLLGRE